MIFYYIKVYYTSNNWNNTKHEYSWMIYPKTSNIKFTCLLSSIYIPYKYYWLLSTSCCAQIKNAVIHIKSGYLLICLKFQREKSPPLSSSKRIISAFGLFCRYLSTWRSQSGLSRLSHLVCNRLLFVPFREFVSLKVPFKYL